MSSKATQKSSSNSGRRAIEVRTERKIKEWRQPTAAAA